MKDPKLLELMKDYRGRDEVPADLIPLGSNPRKD